MTWLGDHFVDVLTLTGEHVYLAGFPLVLGLLIALPLGWLAGRYPRIYPALVVGTGLLYTIPSLALFILLPLVIGTKILDPLNVVIAMTIYTVALLVRTVADGLGSVPDAVNQSATAMGYKRVRRFMMVELPVATPVIAAGLRVAAVSNVSIVSVASLVGVSQLGYFLTDGYQRGFATELVVGIASCIILALVFDALIVWISRLITPWQRVGR